MPSSIGHQHCQAATFGSFHDGLSSSCNSLIVSLNIKPFDKPMGAGPKDMRARVRVLAEWTPAIRCLPKIGLLKTSGQLGIPLSALIECHADDEQTLFQPFSLIG